MLNRDILASLVQRQLERENEEGKAWFETCRDRYGAVSHVEAVLAYSKEAFHPLLHLSQKVFDIYWEPHLTYLAMPSPTVSAYAERFDKYLVVVVHQGLLDLLRLWAIHMVLLDRVMKSGLPPSECEREAKTVTACCKGLSLAMFDHPIRIPDYHLRLDSTAKLNSLQIYVGTLSFVLAHEISHHRLGHTEGAPNLTALRSSKNRHLLLSEHLVFTKQREFEADLAALSCARSNRTLFLVAAQQFLENLALIQIVHGNRAKSHPHAVNRLNALRASLPPDAPKEVAGMFARAEELANSSLSFEKLGRDEVVAGFQINASVAIETLETIVFQLFATRYKDDFVRTLLHAQAEDIADERLRAEANSYVTLMRGPMLHGSAVGTIVSITENYLNFLTMGLTSSQALAKIEAFRSRDGRKHVEGGDNLYGYTRARVQVDHPETMFHQDRLTEFIERTVSFYSW